MECLCWSQAEGRARGEWGLQAEVDPLVLGDVEAGCSTGEGPETAAATGTGTLQVKEVRRAWCWQCFKGNRALRVRMR